MPDGQQALVVDDQPLILLEATDILEKAGFQTFIAHTGDEAVRVLEAHGAKICLLFTDVDMPGATDGFALARHTASGWPHIAIIVASGVHAPREGEMPERAEFIGKPFSAQVVYDRLHRVLPDENKPPSLKDRS